MSDWLRTIGPAVLLFGLHLWWVLSADVAFEDAAIDASAESAKRRAQLRSRRGAGPLVAPTQAKGQIALAASGHPALAIVWKNFLCLRRTVKVRLLIAPVVMALVVGASISSAGGGDDPAMPVIVTAVTLGAMLLLFSNRMIRNDLRHDMLNLALLKTLPVSSRDIVLAEVTSSTLPMAAIQIVMVLIAFVASLFTSSVPIGLSTRVGMVVGAPFALVALNGALLTMQNGLAVFFPGWMRLGTAVSTGVEALGQNFIAMIASVVSLALALIVPSLIVFVVVQYLGLSGSVAIAATLIVSAAVLAAETYGAIQLVGRALARAEP
jgi:hypothetical protein